MSMSLVPIMMVTGVVLSQLRFAVAEESDGSSPEHAVSRVSAAMAEAITPIARPRPDALRPPTAVVRRLRMKCPFVKKKAVRPGLATVPVDPYRSAQRIDVRYFITGTKDFRRTR